MDRALLSCCLFPLLSERFHLNALKREFPQKNEILDGGGRGRAGWGAKTGFILVFSAESAWFMHVSGGMKTRLSRERVGDEAAPEASKATMLHQMEQACWKELLVAGADGRHLSKEMVQEALAVFRPGGPKR